MPTRKEILEALAENLDGLSDRMGESSDRYRDAADGFSDGANRMADASDRLAEQVEYTFNGVSISLENAADRHGKSIEKAGSDFVAGLVGGAAVLAGGMIVGGVLKIFGDLFLVLKEQAEETQKKINMIESIMALQNKYGPMEYDFVAQRSFAVSSTLEERQTILNGLIFDEIVQEAAVDGRMLLSIDPEGEALTDFWEWLDGVNEKLSQIGQTKTT